MPANKEIAEWLREAASQTTKLSQYQHALGYVKTAEETKEKISTWRERSAQVEQMRCGTCAKKSKRIGEWEIITCPWKGCGGCWQWEAKDGSDGQY